jgi:sulfur carrier protein
VTLAGLLEQWGVPQAGVAVAVDGAVVTRASWPATPLSDGAAVEVLTAVQGG